jgi:hypothetical protein
VPRISRFVSSLLLLPALVLALVGHARAQQLISADPAETGYYDLDQQVLVPSVAPPVQQVYIPVAPPPVQQAPWGLRILPKGLIYHPYLAGPKESRTSLVAAQTDELGWTFDTTIGGQFGLVRIGTADPFFPLGIQLDVEASAQLRQANLVNLDVLTSDVRFGIPLSFSHGPHKTKLGVYFLRSHAGDDFQFRFPDLDLKLDEYFERQSLVLGHSVYLSDRFRVYGEAGYAVHSKVSEQWEFQFGAEYAPVIPTSILGAPFLAANAYLREEVNFGGTVTLQGGWSWRGGNGRLLRLGVQYSNGMSSQFTLYDQHEQQIGFGIWLDN